MTDNNKLSNHAVFAAYYNQARHNLFLVFNDIANRLSYKISENEDDLKNHSILNTLKDPKKARDSEIIQTALNKAFPFIVKLSEIIKREYQQADAEPIAIGVYHDFQLDLIELMTNARNFYSHAKTQNNSEPKVDNKLAIIINAALDAAVNTIKSRYSYSEDDLTYLRRNAGKKKNINFRSLFKANDNNHSFELSGWVYFCCLFLSKQEAYQLFGQISGFKANQQKAYQATLKAYSCFSIRLPFVRINAENSEQTLGLDMLNELARCPKILYEHLSAAQQEQYQINASLSEDASEDDIADDNKIPFIRHQDRFIPLMMRYFDQRKTFSKLRFQVDLGDFYFKSYPKTLYADADEFQQPETRRLKKKILSFARLSELKNKSVSKPQQWLDLERTHDQIAEDDYSPYIVKTEPHYHFEEDAIALRICEKPDEIYPLFKQQEDENYFCSPQSERNNDDKDFYLSKYEMMPMAFYQLIFERLNNKKNPHSVEQLLKYYAVLLKQFYKDLTNGGSSIQIESSNDKFEQLKQLNQLLAKSYTRNDYISLSTSRLPKRLVNYLLKRDNRALFKQQTASKIEYLLADIEKRQARLAKQRETVSRANRNRPGDKKQDIIKAGVLADYLAKDILQLQPIAPDQQSKHCGKATGLHFSELQARLAFYERDKNRLPILCKEIALIDSSHPHPFLDDLLKNKHNLIGIASFYDAYLAKKNKYLGSLKQRLERGEELWLTEHFLRVKIEQKETKDYLTELIKEPIYLYRGFFQPFIQQALMQLECEPLSQAIEQAERINTSYLIQLYYQHVEQDSYPPIYNEKRNYELIDRALDRRKGNPPKESLDKHWVMLQNSYRLLPQKDYGKALQQWIKNPIIAVKGGQKPSKEQITQSRQRKYNQFEKNEKQLRLLRTQDQVLFLVVKKILLSLPDINSMKLQQIDKAILEKRVEYKMTITTCLDGINREIYHPDLRIKDIAKFRRFIKNQQLSSVLTYFSTKVCYNRLISELDAYCRQRVLALKEILAFEMRHPLSQLPATKDKLHNKLLIAYFAKNTSLTDEEKETQQAIMNTLRNAFFHNRYPTIYNIKPDYTQAIPFLNAIWHEFNLTKDLCLAKLFKDKVIDYYTADQRVKKCDYWKKNDLK